MEKIQPGVLILGGGVAGMAAAQTFAGLALDVHLVEKAPVLGGHTARWACMATDACKNCGACLSIEMADQVRRQENLAIHLGDTVTGVQKQGGVYEISLGNQESFNVNKIIMATGFSPFDPAGTPSFHTEIYDTVITTAQLNELLRQDKLSGCLQDKKDPKIAFIQCVGSRNREQGRDYCSQVCCKISLRQAEKLAYLYPDADISCFYMDLQIIGKEIRPLYQRLEKQIRLIQGVPAEILKDAENGMLSMVTEDRKTHARTAGLFDLVVLSVGMQPADGNLTTAGLLNSLPNTWGFFNTGSAEIADDVIVAGCAKGPKDILASRQEGRVAAARVIRALNLIPVPEPADRVLVWGDGPQAAMAAETIASKGFSVFMTGAGQSLGPDSPVTALKEERILSVSGTLNQFSLLYDADGSKQTFDCAAIVAAPAPLQSLMDAKQVSRQVTGLEEFARRVETDPDSCPDTTVIILDLFGHEKKQWARLALETAVKVRDLGKQISVIMNKMLVHGAQGQQLYDTARGNAVDFFRFETAEDVDVRTDADTFCVSIKEATLPDICMDLTCDCLVMPPTVLPALSFEGIAGMLNQSLDSEDYLQSANTRHRLVQSPRRGLYFAGTGHDEVDATDLSAEIGEITALLRLQALDGKENNPGVEINQKACAQCLTCIRICPHSALVMNEKDRPQIVPDACFGCHLCVANCPALAIDSPTLATDQVAEKVTRGKTVILACERSATLAAGSVELPDHVDLIPISCACRISSDLILKVLINGASKVVVSGCHLHNCQSGAGSHAAQEGIQKVSALPGLAPETVRWEPVAANETKKMEAIILKA